MTEQHPGGSHAGAPCDGAEWVSRRDIAELAGKSEDTIKRDVDKHGLATRLGPKGEVLVRLDDFVALGRVSGNRPTRSGISAVDAAELKRAQAENVRLAAQLAEATGRLEEARSAQDVVIAQLATKDQQIKELLAVVARAAR